MTDLPTPASRRELTANRRMMMRKTSFRQKIAIFADRNFLLYWLSGNISFLGSIFSMFAMQLLVMNLTHGDAAAMGTVMAITGIPNVIFILFGGVFIDRFSPMKMVILIRYLMSACQAVLAVIVYTGIIEIWMLYIFAVLTGALSAFLMPAQMTIMPSILEPEDLPAANALSGSGQQVIQSFAPAIVGFVLAVLSGYDVFAGAKVVQDRSQELVAYGYAFMINSGTFVISALMLLWVKVLRESAPRRDEDILKGIWEGFAAMGRDPPFRAFIIFVSVSNFFTMGAQAVGQPIMAMERFQAMDIMPAAVALGLIGTASGVGAVLGSLISGFFYTPPERWFGIVMIGMAVPRGLMMIGLGFIHGLYGTMALFVVSGMIMGYTTVLFMTWMQLRVEINMLGRMMSVMMFAMMGIMPISMALAGWAIGAFGLDPIFYASGIAMILVAIIGSADESIQLLGYPKEGAARLLRRRNREA